MTSSKMGEAYGYRASPLPDSSYLTVGTVSTAHSTSDNQRINSLEKSVQTLCSKLDSLLVKNECSGENSVRERKRSCLTCKGQGHIKRACNWSRHYLLIQLLCVRYVRNMDMQRMTENTRETSGAQGREGAFPWEVSNKPPTQK